LRRFRTRSAASFSSGRSRWDGSSAVHRVRRDAGPDGGAPWLFIKGVGVWGINIPIGWGFAIVNFVWWIGIGHAGTLISAILLLLNQSWRNAINRFAEAMTLFAVMCAGMFPVLHTGRPWLAYWLLPYPNTMDSGRSSAARWSGTCSRFRRT
jgi:hypothetical protein